MQRGWATRRLDDEDDGDEDVEMLPSRGLALIADTATTQNSAARATPPHMSIPSMTTPIRNSESTRLDRSAPSRIAAAYQWGCSGAAEGGASSSAPSSSCSLRRFRLPEKVRSSATPSPLSDVKKTRTGNGREGRGSGSRAPFADTRAHPLAEPDGVEGTAPPFNS